MSHILRAVQLHPTLLWSTQLLLEHWDASHIHGTSQQFPLGKSILCALAAVTCSVISSLPTFQHRIPPDRDGNLLQELLLRLLVPSTDRLSALGTQCSVVLPLIKLQHQFPGYITDTKCRPAAKPGNIGTWVQELQLPERKLSFIKEQIYFMHTILDNIFHPSLLMLAAQTRASSSQGARKHERKHLTWEPWALSQAEQKAVTLQGKGTGSAAALSVHVLKPSSFHGGLLWWKFSGAQKLRQLSTIPCQPKDSWSVAIAHNGKFWCARAVKNNLES